ncbi:MAG: LysE family transporter [Desulfobacterales bacterium]
MNLLGDISGHLSIFWMIFSFSFLVALTGAMAPGPLLTYTIIKSVKSGSRGYLTGMWVIAGHAVLEMFIILLLLSGFSFVLKNALVIRAIGVIGGMVLIYFGGTIIRDVYLGKIPADFLKSNQTMENSTKSVENKSMENPMLGGIVISMANPYWWVWWATVGFAFMLQFEISFNDWPRLVAFFLGHEMGDLVWYMLVSVLSFFGIRRLNKKIYYGILVACSVFIVFLGFYLGISTFLYDSAFGDSL